MEQTNPTILIGLLSATVFIFIYYILRRMNKRDEKLHETRIDLYQPYKFKQGEETPEGVMILNRKRYYSGHLETFLEKSEIRKMQEFEDNMYEIKMPEDGRIFWIEETRLMLMLEQMPVQFHGTITIDGDTLKGIKKIFMPPATITTKDSKKAAPKKAALKNAQRKAR